MAASLSAEEKTERLHTLMSLVDSTDDVQCRAVLEAAGFDLNAAVNLFFESHEGQVQVCRSRPSLDPCLTKKYMAVGALPPAVLEVTDKGG